MVLIRQSTIGGCGGVWYQATQQKYLEYFFLKKYSEYSDYLQGAVGGCGGGLYQQNPASFSSISVSIQTGTI